MEVLTTEEIIYLSVTGAIALLAVIAGLTINALKKDWMKYYYYVMAAIVAVYAITVISLNFDAFEQGYQVWLTLGVFAAIAVIIALLVFADKYNVKHGKNAQGGNTKFLVYSGVFIALSFALSYIIFFRLPQGGSITFFSMLPLMLFSYVFGVKKGLLIGFIYGLLQSIQDPWIVHPIQYFLDYPIAFAMIGLTGLFANEKLSSLKFILGVGVAAVARYIPHVISGAVYFGSYGQDYGITSAVAWGFLYNLFVFVDAALCAVGGFFLLKNKQFRLTLDKLKKDCLKNNNISKEKEKNEGVSEGAIKTCDNSVNPDLIDKFNEKTENAEKTLSE